MPEWLNGALSKSVVPLSGPGVRIPLLPPDFGDSAELAVARLSLTEVVPSVDYCELGLVAEGTTTYYRLTRLPNRVVFCYN